jgi:hypothetical protein
LAVATEEAYSGNMVDPSANRNHVPEALCTEMTCLFIDAVISRNRQVLPMQKSIDLAPGSAAQGKSRNPLWPGIN